MHEPWAKKKVGEVPKLQVGGKEIQWSPFATFLGVRFASLQGPRVHLAEPMEKMTKLAEARVGSAKAVLASLQGLLSPSNGLASSLAMRIYRAVVEPVLLYGTELFDPPESAFRVQKKAVRKALNAFSQEPTRRTHAELAMPRLETLALRRRILFALKLLTSSAAFPAATIRAQIDGPSPLPWGAALLRQLDALGVRDRWEQVRRSADAKCISEFRQALEEALLAREKKEFWECREEEPAAFGSTPFGYLALAYRHSHIGYLFRRLSFNPPHIEEIPACYLCGREGGDTPAHLAMECDGGEDEHDAEVLCEYRDGMAKWCARQADLPTFNTNWLALRNIPAELHHNKEFHSSTLDALAAIHRFHYSSTGALIRRYTVLFCFLRIACLTTPRHG